MGKKVRLWENNWLGTSSLAIQFWPLYRIVNEKDKTIDELWDGTNLKCYFRRNVSENLYNSWLEIMELLSTIQLNEEEDEMVWQFTSNGMYSSQCLYKIINFRGIKPVHVSAIGASRFLLEFTSFMWLLTNNKVLTRDNLAKRRKVEDTSCLFCSEKESVLHLVFDCVVAKQCWFYDL